MGTRRLGAVAVVLLAACTMPVQPMTIESEQFPEVDIKCGGEPGLAESECLDWAVQLLSSGPPDTATLVLTYRDGDARCAADYFAANGRMIRTAAVRCPGS